MINFNLGIPATADNPSDDQPLMLANNDNIPSFVAIDHVGFNINGSGKHNQSQYVVSIVDFPAIIGQGTAYSKVAGFGTDAQLFWRFANPATPPLQITGRQYSAGTNGYVPLMNGMLLQWGVIAPTNSTTVPVVFLSSGNVNFLNNNFNIQVTRQRPTSDPGSSYEYYVDNTTVSNSGFNIINRDGHTYGYYWTAIGN